MSITPQALSAEASPPDYQPGSPPRTRKDWQVWLMLGLILFLALSLRLYRIDASSLWYDEGWSVHLAREPLGRALQQIGSEGHTHPPGYYLLLMAWVRLFGSSVLAVRGFSVLVGILTVWAIYRLGSSLFDRRTGLLAAFALAIAHCVLAGNAHVCPAGACLRRATQPLVSLHLPGGFLAAT
jgi:4-amino-4-deoxy-L-arabinose transferase-like glycosyltransferase